MDIYINKDGQQAGPFPLEEVNRKLATGEILPTHLAWYQGAAGWGPVSTVPGVASFPPGTGTSATASSGSSNVSMAVMGAQLSETAAMVKNPGGFISALFDFSFTKFASVRIIKAIYVIQLIILTLVALGSLLAGLGSAIGAFRYAPGLALVTLLGTLLILPLYYLIAICFTRILMETLITFFKLAEDTGTLVQLARKQQADAATSSSSATIAKT